jgi:murein DD-endopeptidase MepM/ murein hydrolase activator NlpD
MTQGFGENVELYKMFGMTGGHNGEDYVAPHGTILFALEDGIIIQEREEKDGWGRHIRLLSDHEEDGKRREWIYAHNSKHLVKVGDHVKRGQPIARMGNSGFVVSGKTPFWKNNPYRGTHLHLGLRMVKIDQNGWSYPGSDVYINVLNYNNGHKGAVPFRSLIESTYEPLEEQVETGQLAIVSLLKKLVSKLTS